jgi:hypothetical protein
MEAVSISETSVNFYKTARRSISRHENFDYLEMVCYYVNLVELARDRTKFRNFFHMVMNFRIL